MKYSFIIPIYNNKKYIRKCLLSIINQKTENKFEIILIDDGSTDLLKEEINDLLYKYYTIKYYKQSNLGVSVARNVGIMKSCGEYIIFVDSDDEVFSDFLDNCDKIIDIEIYDVIKTKVECHETNQKDGRFEVPCFNKLSGINSLLKFCKSNKIFATPWSYIFRREFLINNNLHFKEHTTHEDYGLIPIVLSKAKYVKSVDWYGYKYIKRNDSFTMLNDNANEIIRIKDFINHTYDLIDYFSGVFPKESHEICNYFYDRLNTKISHLNLNVKLQLDYKQLNNIQQKINCLSEKDIVDDLSEEYAVCIKKSLKYAKSIFKTNLLSVVLGGSCGKCNAIPGWSDIDVYIILKEYKIADVKKYNQETKQFNLHVGITYYTLGEIETGMIDSKTRVMIYEKQYLNVNPTLYGYCNFNTINYKDIVSNDRNNIPNVIHEFRRMHIDVLSNKKDVDKKYIKKLLLLLKCYLNIKGVFTYGYNSVVNKFLEIYNKKNSSTKAYYFDIINWLTGKKKSKKTITFFSEKVLDFIVKDMEEIFNG